MKSSLKTLLIFLLSCAAVQSQAQSLSSSPLVPQVVAPSPDAASLGKYAEIPVSTYTGIPNISIPLHDIESGKFSMPVSLSYHAGGVKVSDISSSVGLGWSLNAGGV